MTLTTQHKLLIVVAVLALLRFVVQPWLSHQQEQREQLAFVTKQLERAERLIYNADNIQQAADQLTQSRQQLNALFPAAATAGQYQLERQQSLQQQLSEHAVEVTLFDWLSQQSLHNEQINVYQARLVLQGEPVKLMQGYLAAFASHSWIQVRQIEMRERRSGRRQASVQATLTLLVEFTSLTPLHDQEVVP